MSRESWLLSKVLNLKVGRKRRHARRAGTVRLIITPKDEDRQQGRFTQNRRGVRGRLPTFQSSSPVNAAER